MIRSVRVAWGLALAAALGGIAAGESGFGGLDLSGISAFATPGAFGASAGAGIPLGPSQKPRRQAPRVAPAPPEGAIPAAAPPLDPVLQGPVLGAPQLAPPGTLVGEARPVDPLPPPPAAESLRLPEAVPDAGPGYGDPALGYGPPVSYAMPPRFEAPLATPAAAEPPPPPPPPRVEPPAAWRFPDGPDRRAYLAGVLGADFATLEVGDGPNASSPGFTTGGAVGVAFERPGGWFRGEFEARARDPVTESFVEPGIGSATVSASDGWTTLVNGWRDFELTDRIGCYLGGGIGGGGYRVVFDGEYTAVGGSIAGSTRLNGFAWQAGTGLTWLFHDRVALDLGYRFVAVAGGQAELLVDLPPISFTEGLATRYGASELLVTVRVFEPFRRWGD